MYFIRSAEWVTGRKKGYRFIYKYEIIFICQFISAEKLLEEKKRKNYLIKIITNDF